jgi:type I restriction-modification system DNA methylase subunit
MSQATLGSSPHQNSKLFSGYYLDERVDELDAWDCDDEARAAFEELQELWAAEGDLVASYNEDELLGAWIDEVLDILGFDTLQETTLPEGGGYNDRLLFDSAEARRKGARAKRDGNVTGMYGNAAAVLEAKQYDADFTKRFSEQRSYRDASHQIKYYLERTPERVKWGVLTNGRKWRLYGTKDYATEVYYEVDLVELLTQGDLEQFKYFFVFFRPEAFGESAGTFFLNTVWNESETAAQELGEDLQDNVFTALRVLGEGFVETNDLAIDPDDEARLAELKEQSLVLLYRLMFVFYAESRGLIHPENPSDQAEYDEHFSLDQRLLEIHNRIEEGDTYDDYSGYSTQIWGQLQDLFGLIDEGQEDLGIPPYNGGLFDDETHSFLAENEVADRYIAEVIHRLGTTEGEDGNPVTADYADLDTRHLGSIYEGLLEHEFRIAPEAYAAVADDGGQVWKPATEVTVAEAVETVEEGELYVVNDDGERKATGAYYTPDYVVSYIVEETVDPLLADIKADLAADGLAPSDREYFRRFWERVLDLKVLDPAMGSAHFLTSATGYLTEQVMEVVREQEIQSYDEQELRRTIAKECIYGVDINGMAVELGKLSMWLETLAADKPLAFLDHHLKAGNSLVGSDITDVLSEDNGNDDGQLTLTQSFARARQETLGHVMNLMQDLLAIDNDELDDIKSMEELYDEIRDDPLYGRLFEIANVHTAEQFGLDVPEGVYEEMAGAIDDGDEWDEIRTRDWFASAQATADEQSFFHWELEYPEVFFGEDGGKREDAGFDAVVGNPPWVNIGRTAGNEDTVNYVNSVFETAEYQVDLYTLFLEQSVDIVGRNNYIGMIVPDPWLNNYRTPKIRELLLVQNNPLELISTPVSAFPEVNAEHLIGIFRHEQDTESSFDRGELDHNGNAEVFDEYPTSLLKEEEEYVVYSHSNVSSAISQIESVSSELGGMYETIRGVGPYHHNHQEQHIIEERAYHSDSQEDESYVPELKGKHLSRYNINWEGDTWISYGDWLAEPREKRFFEGKRLLLREILGKRFEVAVIEEEFVVDRGIYIALQGDQSVDLNFTLAVLGSAAPVFWFREKYNEDDELFPKLRVAHFEMLPIPEVSFDEDTDSSLKTELLSEYESQNYSEVGSKATKYISETGLDEQIHDFLAEIAQYQTTFNEKLEELNLNLLDHLGNYSDGQSLADIGLTQPPAGAADSILQATTETYPNLRVGAASVVRESASTVEVRLSARYKPSEVQPEGAPRTETGEAREGEALADEVSGPVDDREPDQWGYVETDFEVALRITDLSDVEADLIEAFVPVAIEEAGGFADFRETATKTNSLVDRLRKLTLPAVADVESGLESYTKTKERAEELEAKIEETDALIDEIVYELYGLTDEEIEIVEEAVGE